MVITPPFSSLLFKSVTIIPLSDKGLAASANQNEKAFLLLSDTIAKNMGRHSLSDLLLSNYLNSLANMIRLFAIAFSNYL